MAGIGFNLKKILEGRTYGSTLKALFFSTMIVAGPWLLSIITIFTLNYCFPGHMDIADRNYFKSAIIYVFAFSLIMTGLFQFSLTRYLADRLYMREKEALVPALNTAAVALLTLQAAMGGVFFCFTDGEPLVKILVVMIYLTISLLWLAMIFLTALRDYRAIAGTYLFGTVITIVTAVGLGGKFGLAGYLFGYWIGHFAIVILWAGRIFIEFGSELTFDPIFWQFFWKNKNLILMGLFYNLAIWADKFVFWLSPQATSVTEFFRVHLVYDSATFFAFLTIIPALAIFLLQVETGFYQQYRRYYLGILEKFSYRQIEQMRENMALSLREGVGLMIRYQGIISFLCVVFAPKLVTLLGLSPVIVPVFRIAVLGAFMHCLTLVSIIILLYFDFQAVVLGICIFFVVSNAVLTGISTLFGMSALGYGYFLSAFLSAVVAYYSLDYKLRNLEYYTFASQPLGAHREDGAG